MGEFEFRKYCREHQLLGDDLNGLGENHIKFVNYLFQNPPVLGIRGVDEKFREVLLITEDRKVEGVVDLVFFGDQLYICETRVSDRYGRGIGTQLKEQYNWIRENFNVFPVRIGIQKYSEGLHKRVIPPLIKDLISVR